MPEKEKKNSFKLKDVKNPNELFQCVMEIISMLPFLNLMISCIQQQAINKKISHVHVALGIWFVTK